MELLANVRKTMRLIVNIKNSLSKSKEIILLGGITGETALPKGIKGVVDVIDDKNEVKRTKIEYSDLIKQLDHVPYCVKVYHTSNNRQISFFTYTMQSLMYGERYEDKPYMSLEPTLTKVGNKRRSVYSKKHDCYTYSLKWNPKKWNIADTHEMFILDNKIVFELKIKSKQKFRIIIDIEPKIQIGSQTQFNKNENA